VTDRDLPVLFRTADEAANQAQHRFFVATGVTLVSAVLAPTLGAFGIEAVQTDWAAVVATGVFGVGFVVGLYLLAAHPERQWYRGRAAAESIKTLSWRYAVGSSDFPIGDHSADAELIERLAHVTNDLENVDLGSSSGHQITDAMRALRASPLDARKVAYREGRLDDQRKWYSAASRKHGYWALAWRLISLSAQLVGIVGGVLRATLVIHFDALGIAAAAAAAAIAWLQTREHATVSEAYRVAARELSLADEQARLADDAEWPSVVDSAEAAISREHTLWRARRSS
jgi:SMODS and SLOG-associating 2TM effector domain 3/SMODS and SLOG-associating 2TM effector domain 1